MASFLMALEHVSRSDQETMCFSPWKTIPPWDFWPCRKVALSECSLVVVVVVVNISKIKNIPIWVNYRESAAGAHYTVVAGCVRCVTSRCRCAWVTWWRVYWWAGLSAATISALDWRPDTWTTHSSVAATHQPLVHYWNLPPCDSYTWPLLLPAPAAAFTRHYAGVSLWVCPEIVT